MTPQVTNLHQKTPNIIYCDSCDFKCSKNSDFNRHLLTAKHRKSSLANKTGDIGDTGDKNYAKAKHICGTCNKEYKSRNGLWKHTKNCARPENAQLSDFTPNIQLTPELVIKLIEQNKELQQTLIEQNKELQHTLLEQNKTIIELSQKACTKNTNTINNNCGNTNKTFNLQLFLNETCKDAINMSDFINQIQVSISDLETTGSIGYAEGISKVFNKNLNEMNYNDRPIHCSDSKREIIYIRENNQWTKDDDKKTNLTRAIKCLANKNIKQISEWQKLHPEFADPDSKENDKYMKIVLNSMSGSTKEESDKNYEKIAKNVIKNVVIEKEK